MKKVLISIFSGALMLGVAAAQEGATPPPASPSSEPQTSTPAEIPAQTPTQQPAPEPPAQAPQTQPSQTGAASTPTGAITRLAPGSVIPVSLTKTIDAKKAKTGDEVVARVTQDMKSNSGEVIFAKDTKVMGHVTEAQARSKEQKESELGIAFDHAVMKNGNEMQMPMSIQAIIGPQNSSPQNNQSSASGGYGQGSDSAGAGTSATSQRAGGMGGGSTPPPTPPAAGGDTPGNAQTGANTRPPVTAQTEGVVGISDLKLTTAAPAANQGSLVSSEKNNVKLESGTLMLLRVNQ